MTRRQRDEWRFRLCLLFAVLCMTVSLDSEELRTPHEPRVGFAR